MDFQPARFRASYLKLARAKKHFSELKDEIDTYLAYRPLEMIWEPISWESRYSSIYPQDTPLLGLVAHISHVIPESLAPIIGDTVHNLRSALDIMMCELVSNIDPSLSKKAHFPFWEDESKKREALTRSRVGVAGDGIVDLIGQWQPYRRGASRLYALHELDNCDKHRSIIPAITGAEFSKGGALSTEPVIDPFPARQLVRDGQIFMTMPAALGELQGQKIPCACNLAFDGDEEIRGYSLLDELSSQVNIGEAVLYSFETGTPPHFVTPTPRKPAQVATGVWLTPPEFTPAQMEEFIKAKMCGE